MPLPALSAAVVASTAATSRRSHHQKGGGNGGDRNDNGGSNKRKKNKKGTPGRTVAIIIESALGTLFIQDMEKMMNELNIGVLSGCWLMEEKIMIADVALVDEELLKEKNLEGSFEDVVLVRITDKRIELVFDDEVLSCHIEGEVEQYFSERENRYRYYLESGIDNQKWRDFKRVCLRKVIHKLI